MTKGLIIIIVAPSGAGKSSFLERIVREDERLVDTITYTTRIPRKGEEPGKPYHFVDMKKFNQLKEADFFVETAEVHGNFYGTPLDQIQQTWSQGKAAIMDVDVQGALTIKKRFPEAKTIFIQPPSIDELRRRITSRSGGTEPSDLELRLKNAHREMALADHFDFRVMNDVFEPSYQRFKKIIEDLLK